MFQRYFLFVSLLFVSLQVWAMDYKECADAIISNNCNTVCDLLQNKSIQPIELTSGNPSLLNMAVGLQRIEIVELFLNRGIPVSELTKGEYSSFHVAISTKNTKIVLAFLKQGISESHITSGLLSPLSCAKRTNCDEIIKLLEERCGNQVPQDAISLLKSAVMANNVEEVTSILEQGIDKAELTKGNPSLLKLAITGKKNRIVKLFLQQGIDKAELTKGNPSLLKLAFMGKNIELVKFFLELDIDKDEIENSLLTVAKKFKWQEMVTILEKDCKNN